MELLLFAFHAANEEAQANAKQQIGKNRSENGGLDNLNRIERLRGSPGNQNGKDHYFNDGPQCCLDDQSNNIVYLAHNLLSAEANQVGRWDHGDVVEDENRKMPAAGFVVTLDKTLSPKSALAHQKSKQIVFLEDIQ